MATKSQKELIFEGDESLIFIEEIDGKKYARKIIKDEFPSNEQIIRFRNEFEITKDLGILGVRNSIRFETINHKHSILFDYIDGETLQKSFNHKNKTLEEILTLYIKIVDRIARIHEQDIIHKDLMPENILIEKKTHHPIIIDFGISSKLNSQTSNFSSAETLKGTLNYMSPEQTGRVNRQVDSRSDLYSLGICLFETLTGQLPYVSDDSFEIVHFHVAKEIPLVHQINRTIPETISTIVWTLMAKNAEDRYQTAAGLRRDLEICLDQLLKTGEMKPFELQQEDFSGKFRIPQKLYGREVEISKLLGAIDRVSKGSAELFLVSGYSGVGKTALIGETYKTVTAKKAYFLSGKFEQYQKKTPYYAIVQVFSEFCNIVLSENKDRLEYWKKIIQESLGENGGLIIESIPDYEKIIGPQPPIQKLDGQESLNRIKIVTQNFIRGICTKETPIIIFTDDLQWADVASLDLIKMLVTDTSINHLLWIGAFRNNEVQAGHPLLNTISESIKDHAVVNQISLQPLKKEDISLMIKEALQGNDSITNELTEIVFQKTGGNAFFVKEFLKNLYQEKNIFYDVKTKQWQIDFDAIHKRNITTNVVDLLISQLIQLPESTQKLLSYGACIGNVFDISILSGISSCSPSEITQALWIPLQEQYIVSLTDGYAFTDILDSSIVDKISFEFTHDRIQQAAYSLLNDNEKKEVHLNIAKLLESLHGRQGSFLFRIVNNFNLSRSLISDPDKIFHILKLNIKAANEAMASGAFASAKEYIDVAEELAKPSIWEDEFEIALKLHQCKANLEYLNGDFELSEKHIHSCLERVKSPEIQSELYFLLMQNYSTQARYQDSISAARAGLKEMDFYYPDREDAEALIPAEMGKIFTYFEKNPIEGILKKEVMTDTRFKSIMVLLDNLSPNTYVANESNLWVMQTLYKINLTLEHGLTPQGGYAFEELAIICNMMNNFDVAYSCAELGMKILEKFKKDSPRHYSRTGHLFINYNMAFKKHIQESIKISPSYYQMCLDSGELLFGGYMSMFITVNHHYWGKEPVSNNLLRIKDALLFLEKINHPLAFGSVQALDLISTYLSTPISEGNEIKTATLTEKSFLDIHTKSSNFYAIVYYHLIKAEAVLYLNDSKTAYDCVLEVEKAASVVSGNAAQESTYRLSYIIALVDRITNEELLEEYAPTIISMKDQFKLWSDFNKSNFEHKYLLAEAEWSQINKQDNLAILNYEAALQAAESSEFLRDVAFIHQRAAKFWSSRNNKTYSKLHREKAYNQYMLLGYNRIADQIQKEALEEGQNLFSASALKPSTGHSEFNDMSYDQFDIQSILKASNILSEEIVFEKLVDKLLKIVIENVGGQRAVLIIPEETTWVVTSDYNINKSDEIVIDNKPLEHYKELPQTVINYVIRSVKEVYSSDNQLKNIFSKDTYIHTHSELEFLCLPLVYKGNLVGIVYVENEVEGTLFVENRMKILMTLASQMAVSIENANLYKRQSQLNLAYQKFVPLEFIQSLGHTNILQVKLGDSIDREMTVMFCDIRSYTSLAEGMSTQENFDFINAFLEDMVPPIRKNNGFINHFLGDGFIALFENSPKDSLQAAIDMNIALVEFNQHRIEQGKVPVAFGIGLHTGPVMMGIIGDSERNDANVLSDAVNLSSRLEGLNKEFMTSVIVSHDTHSLVRDYEDFQFRFLGKAKVKGKSEGLDIYELVNISDSDVEIKKLKTMNEYHLGLDNYFNKNFKQAVVHLKNVLSVFPEDYCTLRYLQKSEKYAQNGVDKDWIGIEDFGK